MQSVHIRMNLSLSPPPKKILDPPMKRNLCMHDFQKLHHNWDEYMGVQKERQGTFLTAFEHREKEARNLFAAQYWYRSCLWMSLPSKSSVSNTIPRYLYWSTDFTYWPPTFNTGVAVLFALLASLLQQKCTSVSRIFCTVLYAFEAIQILGLLQLQLQLVMVHG